MDKETSAEITLEIRKCLSCCQPINLDNYISWELTEFCNVDCVLRYQKSLKSCCSTCLGKIHESDFGKNHMRLRKSHLFFCSFNCKQNCAKSMKICMYCERTQPPVNSLDFMSIRVYLNNSPKDMNFCSDLCLNNFQTIVKMCPPEIPPGSKCSVCNSETGVTRTIKHEEKPKYLCDARCQAAFNFVMSQSGSVECKLCENYISVTTSNRFAALEGNQTVPFCSKSCKSLHMVLKTKLVACCWCRCKKSDFGMLRQYVEGALENIFCSADCFYNAQVTAVDELFTTDKDSEIGTAFKKSYVYIKTPLVEQKNVATMCSVITHDKSTVTKIMYVDKGTQTDLLRSKILLPTPIPIYVPTPVLMYSVPVPYILPVAIPVPIPIFLPCTQNSLNKIQQNLKITPKNACEADILKMAEIIAEEEKAIKNDADPQNSLDLCEKSTQDFCENIDLEYALSSYDPELDKYLSKDERPAKIGKYSDTKEPSQGEFDKAASTKAARADASHSPITFKTEMRLDHNLGINAWKQWASKILHLRKGYTFVTSEILNMTPKELCFALCLFVKELRKPNGDEYAPDTIYYLCLGIQFYLDANGRDDSIFFEPIYQKFIECLDEFAKKFCTLYDDESHFIVTRVEEEHLWETKQLGCWSPYTLLNTLVYYNTKYYCRSNLEEHMELSFFHIMKGRRKSKTENYFIMRLYPKSKTDDKRVYEQFQNKEDPLRCPVKLYEFYLSKCPESVKNSPNMLYLKPEKYLLSDSPLWYSTNPMPKEFLAALINRVKMVKEINVALLSR